MGKSERKSKIKRKFRALKRIKNQPKELKHLNKILDNMNKNETIEDQNVVEKSKLKKIAL
jgi:hypothetical protein